MPMRAFAARLVLAWLCLAAAPAMPAAPAAAADCGAPAGECPTASGFYRLVLPAAADGPVPALVFLHGYAGSSAGIMKNGPMRAALADRGYALVVPEGQPTPGRPDRLNWSVRDGRPFPRDDIGFLAEVLDDAARRGVDRGRVLLAGFSRGGSMVWDVACHAPGTARAYAPVAGAFWEPLPARCAGPVALFHTHGWTDRVVPIEGRAVAGGTRIQGDAFASLRILRAALGCDPQMPDAMPVSEDGTLWFREWLSCPAGRIDLMLHPDGHRLPTGWLEQALDWFEDRLAEG